MVEKIVEHMFGCVANRMIAATLIDEHNLASPKIIELQHSMVGLFLHNSKCATEFKEKYYMLKLLKFIPLNATKIINSWEQRGDKRIILIKLKNGDCVGYFGIVTTVKAPPFSCVAGY